MNRAIAEQLGWTEIYDISPDVETPLYAGKPPNEESPERLPDWQHSIADAMGLLDEWECWEIIRRISDYEVSIFTDDDRDWEDTTAEANELPEAICQAFLAAKGATNESK